MKRPRKRPGFHPFLVSRLGDPRPFWHFARTWFLKPLGAPSFRAFWTYWNPVYGYLLLYFVYRPLRRYLPRSIATFLTFVVSGLLLHDLPFTISAEIVRGQAVVPSGTILPGAAAVIVVCSEPGGSSQRLRRASACR